MASFVGKPPLLLSLFLLLVGVAGLGTAVLLVVLHFQPGGRAFFWIEQGTTGPAVAHGVVPDPGPPEEPGPADAATPPGGPPFVEEADTDTDAEGPPPVTGPWRLPLDFDTYAPDEAGEAVIEAVAALLAADPEAGVRVIGVCGARLSKARAWQAARVVRKRLVAAGVRRDCCETRIEQSRDIDGVEVRLELIGEGS